MIIKETEELKKRLDTKIQTIAVTVDDTMITEVCRQKTSVVDDRSEAASEAIQSLQNNIFIIDKVDDVIVTPNTFIALQKIAEKTHAAHKQLNDVSNQHRNVSLSFIPNPAITKFLSSRNELGEIKEGTTATNALTYVPEISFPPNLPTKSESQVLKASKHMHLVFLLAYIVVYIFIILQPHTEIDTKMCDFLNITLTKQSKMTAKLSKDELLSPFQEWFSL